jgi:hypothetical protein
VCSAPDATLRYTKTLPNDVAAAKLTSNDPLFSFAAHGFFFIHDLSTEARCPSKLSMHNII